VRRARRSTELGARTNCWKSVKPDAGAGEEDGVSVAVVYEAVIVVVTETVDVVVVVTSRGYVGAEETVLARRNAAMKDAVLYMMKTGYYI